MARPVTPITMNGNQSPTQFNMPDNKTPRPSWPVRPDPPIFAETALHHTDRRDNRYNR